MTREEFLEKNRTELSLEEQALINPNVYRNPEHLEYYKQYRLEEYEWCWDWLMMHRHLLNLKHTPKENKKLAKLFIKSARKMEGVETVRIKIG